MTFTYTPTTDIGKVRRYTGDTVEAEAELSDAEIQAWLDDEGGDCGIASVKILRSLSAKWAKRSNLTTGNEKMDLSSVSAAYAQAALDLEKALGTNRRLTNVNVNRLRDSDRYRNRSRARNYDYPS